MGIDAASYSATGGEQWIEIPKNSILIGNVHVVFDSDFANNKFVYLADDKLDSNGNKVTSSIAGTVFREEVPCLYRLEDADMMAKGNNGACHSRLACHCQWPSINGSAPSCRPIRCGICQNRVTLSRPFILLMIILQLPWAWTIVRSAGRIKPWQPMPKYGVGWDCLDIYYPRSQENVLFTLEPSSLKYCGCCTLDSYTTLFALDNEAFGVFNGDLQTPALAGYTPLTNQGMLWAYIRLPGQTAAGHPVTPGRGFYRQRPGNGP